MKKCLVFALALGLAVMFAVPALAFHYETAKGEKLYIGGVMLTDIGYWNRSEEFAGQWGGRVGEDDRTEFILSVPRHSRIRGSVEAGNVGGYWEIGLGRDLIAAQEQTEANSAADKTWRQNYVENRKLYGYYKFGGCQILAGKTDGSIFIVHPYQNLGFEHNNHVIGLGWGALYDDRAAQVRWSQDVSKVFGYQVSLIQPNVIAENIGGSFKDSFAQFPRVDVMFKLNFGPVSIFPGASWQMIEWENLPSGWDDDLTMWVAQLPLRLKVGAFALNALIGYGENLNPVFPLQSGFHRYQRDASGKIENSKGLYGFVDAAFTAGPVTPHFYFGYDRAENDRFAKDDNDRKMYGVGVNWKVKNNFYVVPEFTYYDYGENPNNGSDLGTEWLGGVQFQFVF